MEGVHIFPSVNIQQRWGGFRTIASSFLGVTMWRISAMSAERRAPRKEKKITTSQIEKKNNQKIQTCFRDFSGSAANFLQAYDAPQFVTERERERGRERERERERERDHR
jgi:hypothetical protein